MSWKIDYTAEVRQDLRDIFEYIANVLYEPDTASLFFTFRCMLMNHGEVKACALFQWEII